MTAKTPQECQAQIMSAHGPDIIAALQAARRVPSQNQRTAEEKLEHLNYLADNINRWIMSLTPCIKGCSHCCYMAVSVTDSEAAAIGRYLGRNPSVKGSISHYVMNNGGQEKYAGVPCSMLVDGKCSIYPMRPIACKLHHHLGPDESACKLEGVAPEDRQETQSLDLHAVHYAFVDVALKRGEGFADIREYFPRKEA